MWKIIIAIGLFAGSVFSNGSTDNSDCLTKSNGIYASPSECSTFFMCSGGVKTVHNCPAPLQFSPSLLVCDWPANVKCEKIEGADEVDVGGGNASNFDCSDKNSGLYPNPEDCTTFYECSNGDGFLFDCPPGLIFNPTYFICDWPSESNVCHETTRPPQTTSRATTQAPIETTEDDSSSEEETTEEAAVTEDNSGETTQRPVDPETTQRPADPETTQRPVDPETTQRPVDPETTQRPVDPETTQHPVDPETTQRPVDPETTQRPVDPETTQRPVDPETTQSPVEPETTQRPVDPETTQRPVDPVTTEGSADPETTVRVTTTEKPKFCVGKPNGLYPNDEDCTTFYKCTNGYTYLIKCPANNYFDPDRVGCFEDPSVCNRVN